MAINKRLIAGAPTGGGGACTTDTLQILGDSSCIAYYKMADATDESGSYNGTATNVDFNVEGKYGLAGSFNGTSSQINLGNSQPFSVTQTGEISVSLWVKTTDDTAYLYAKGDDSAGKYEHNLELLANGTLKSAIYTSSASLAAAVTSTATVNDGNWHHIVVTIDNGSSMSLYIDNGTPVTTTSWSGSASYQSTVPFLLGAFEGIPSAGSKLNGSFDQVRIFNKAVSASEVGTLYNEVQCATAVTPSAAFNTVLYTGTNSNQSITTVGFKPDLTWVKARQNAYPNILADSVRGAGNNKMLISDFNGEEGSTDANYANAQAYGYISSLVTNGFSLASGTVNGSFVGTSSNVAGNNYVAWNWYAPTSETNNAGSNGATIASTIKKNVDAGFSIASYTGNGTQNATIVHGLTSPQLTIVKNTAQADSWFVGSTLLGTNEFMELNTNGQRATNSDLNYQILSTTFKTTSSSPHDMINESGETYIMYTFKSVEGYSRIGSYVGTGATGKIVVTGFEPAWLIIKKIDGTGAWNIFDNKRNTTNPRNTILQADKSDGDITNTTYNINFHTNGFEFLNNNGDWNGNGSNYLFMAFAQDPDTTPATKADSFEAKAYTGNGAVVLSNGMKPDFTWIKNRDATPDHVLFDSIRGVQKFLRSNTTDNEGTATDMLSSFNDNGFTVGNATNTGSNSVDYISWNWKAADHDRNLATINQDGSVTSLVSANPAAGFSIVRTKSPSSTINFNYGHQLSKAPELVMVKTLNIASYWEVIFPDTFGSATGSSSPSDWNRIKLNEADAKMSSNAYLAADGTKIYNGAWQGNTELINYCFHSVDGYQKVGSYSGNQSLNTANQINFGFTPRFVLIKNTTNSSSQWMLFDSVRTNGMALYANQVTTESDYTTDLLLSSQGLEFKSTNINVNQSGATYIYLAIA